MINITVSYARPERQMELHCTLHDGATVATAIEQSGILTHFPEITYPHVTVGIYGKRAALTTILTNQDRVEIYRSLTIDPKEARRLRVKKKGPTRSRSSFSRRIERSAASHRQQPS